ncbi:transcription termination factor MTEF1, chloroplastic [Mangifera indica]|uniref:transcription termination factor MTEF1, chloroplastic n=1 Tax=Mangifera indica TaxID=29780 RepID=UPI001CF97A2D|nr:transcription termination factor MTEF1, chloroplastic [Mangifera indica]
MQETLSSPFSHPKHLFPSPHHDFRSLSRPGNLHFPSFSSKTITPLPLIPPKISQIPSIAAPPSTTHDSHSDFQEKMLYLDSIGLDFFQLINSHSPIITTSLPDIKSTVDLLTSINLTNSEFRRIISICPQILTTKASDILPIFTFLLREAKVNGSDLRRVINRRPRLLVCSVKSRLRPTLYFLQSIGIAEVNKHTYLLSCSVEEKFLPRFDYFQNIGFSRRETTAMFRRFPQLFNYSVKENYEPKLNYFVVEMGRDLKELKDFPQYFSFSLENRIKPRHQACVEKGVCFPLNVLLRRSEEQFRHRLEVCCKASLPLKTSPLSSVKCDIDSI